MSWWTKFRNAAESVASAVSPFDVRGKSARKETSGVTGAANRIRNAEEGFVNKALGKESSAAKREQQKAINDQIKAYKEQTEMTRKQLDEARTAAENEKRRVQEKQIRSLRRTYRAQGASMLGNAGASNDMSPNLGG